MRRQHQRQGSGTSPIVSHFQSGYASNKRTRRRRGASMKACSHAFLAMAAIQAGLLLLQGAMIDSDRDVEARNLRRKLDRPTQEKTTASVSQPVAETISDKPIFTGGTKTMDQMADRDTTGKHEATPLDNYFSRRHILPHDKKHLPILIIGGSDGSGTRAFVDALGHLGAPILVDDPSTLDVHAETIYNGEGWPPLVRNVLNHTYSANYDFRDLPIALQTDLLHEMKTFQEHYNVRAGRLLQAAFKEKKKLPTGMRYGFKAPVSMLLLPLLHRVYGSIKFVHVVRDGRDVALSSNTSPVEKFFDSFYRDAEARRNNLQSLGSNETMERAMAMQLWNDWNTQVLDWERAHVDGESFDFLAMRTEDLLNPDTRFDALMELADFIGSTKTEEEICCLSQRELQDMGQSAVGAGGSGNTRSDVRQDVFRKKPNPMERSSWLSREAMPGRIINPGAVRQDEDIVEQIKSLNDPRSVEDRKRIFREMEKRMNEKAKAKKSRQRRLLEIEPTADSEDDVISRIKKLHDASLETRRRFEEVNEEADLPESMLEVTEVEKRKKRQKDEILENIPDPEIREKFRKFIAQREPKKLKAASPGEVKQRYGKWVVKLKDNPDLSNLLHEEGSKGLRAFGYEPSAPFMDRRSLSSFQCQVCQQ